MFLVMSAAPLAMMGAKEGGHGFDETADAIRAHLLAMFAPGALGTGDLVRRAGPDVVAHVGCGLFVACAVFSNAFVPVTAADDVGGGGRVPYWAYRDGLVVLGLAWHLVFVAGSAALSDYIREDARRVRVAGVRARRGVREHERCDPPADGLARAERVRGGERRAVAVPPSRTVSVGK